jgi:hypothetical protein
VRDFSWHTHCTQTDIMSKHLDTNVLSADDLAAVTGGGVFTGSDHDPKVTTTPLFPWKVTKPGPTSGGPRI